MPTRRWRLTSTIQALVMSSYRGDLDQRFGSGQLSSGLRRCQCDYQRSRCVIGAFASFFAIDWCAELEPK